MNHQFVIDNEIYLTNEYFLSEKIDPFGSICLIGRHSLTERLRAVVSGTACCEVYPSYAEAMMKADCRALWYLAEAVNCDLNDLRGAAESCRKSNRSLLLIVLLKNIPLNDTIRRYAEMELLSAMDDQLSPILEVLRNHAGADVKAIILDRLMGAEYDGIGLCEIVREAEQKGTVTVTQDMAHRQISALYVPDAVNAIITVGTDGKPGNIYNAASFSMSEYTFRSKIYTMLAPHGVNLNVTDGDGSVGHAALSCGKLSSLGWEPVCSFDDALRYTLQAYTAKFDIQTDFIHNRYDGKLSGLRKLQLDMLREIDRICRKHDIPYFLSGGSMLGAVRHKGYIPWDDDIDVAFLRENFERFREIAPDELDPRFRYMSWTRGEGYHYFFDRITARDTYFASKYSDGYEMPKGISVDIFVYDSVPDSERAQVRHWRRLMNQRLIMNVRWKNIPRPGKAYLLSKILLPILRLKTMEQYSASYEKVTRRWEKQKTSTVMPPATDHDHHPSMPREWFTEVIPCTFEGVDTFLPKGYDGFLKGWYGDDYMTMLPLAKQQPYHDYYRLDLGSTIDKDKTPHFDYRGELS